MNWEHRYGGALQLNKIVILHLPVKLHKLKIYMSKYSCCHNLDYLELLNSYLDLQFNCYKNETAFIENSQ